MDFLPASRQEIEDLGWAQPDFVLVTGDAYVDHPSFGVAIIGRLLQKNGYKIAILSQPDWKTSSDFRTFGRPRLGFLVSSGSVDSMVNNYTVMGRRRKKDAFSPGGVPGRRPNRAVIVYANMARQVYKDCPVVIGGLEASLRRLGHYDFWDDRVRRSILLDAKADLLIYGMAERAVLEVASALNDGFSIRDIVWINGTVFRTKSPAKDTIILPDFDSLSLKHEYVKSFLLQYHNSEHMNARALAERYADGVYVVQNPPQPPLNQTELDELYAMPFTRLVHTDVQVAGVPAAEEVKFSITACRGCFGDCSFCALTCHQGRLVTGRSKEAIVKEAVMLTHMPDFKGYIHDVGGPTANFRRSACDKQAASGACPERSCLFPGPCKNLDTDHSEFMDILRAVRALPGVKKVFLRSGLRYDYLMAAPDRIKILKEICEYHVSGFLKTAPEHVSSRVLCCMRKPDISVYEQFSALFSDANKDLGKEQYILPYFISSHPGCELDDAVDLALFLKKTGWTPDQMQDFYPSPGTAACCMYYTGIDPFSGTEVFVARSKDEKRLQRALLQLNKPGNRKLVKKALEKSGRTDMSKQLF